MTWMAHVIVLPGGGYAEHAPHEAEPVADWLTAFGVPATVFRYPLHARHPAPLVETQTYQPSVDILLGANPSADLRRETSLDALVTRSAPPFFLWHTAEDIWVPPGHTYVLATALAAYDVPHAVHVFAHGPHSLGLAQAAGDASTWTALATSWISEQLR